MVRRELWMHGRNFSCRLGSWGMERMAARSSEEIVEISASERLYCGSWKSSEAVCARQIEVFSLFSSRLALDALTEAV